MPPPSEDVPLGHSLESSPSAEEQWSEHVLSDSAELADGPGLRSVRKRHSTSKSLPAVLALLSAVAIVVLVTSCHRSLRGKKLRLRGGTRRLSEGGGESSGDEDTMEAMVQLCLEMEVDYPVLVAPDSPVEERMAALQNMLREDELRDVLPGSPNPQGQRSPNPYTGSASTGPASPGSPSAGPASERSAFEEAATAGPSGSLIVMEESPLSLSLTDTSSEDHSSLKSSSSPPPASDELDEDFQHPQVPLSEHFLDLFSPLPLALSPLPPTPQQADDSVSFLGAEERSGSTEASPQHQAASLSEASDGDREALRSPLASSHPRDGPDEHLLSPQLPSSPSLLGMPLTEGPGALSPQPSTSQQAVDPVSLGTEEPSTSNMASRKRPAPQRSEDAEVPRKRESKQKHLSKQTVGMQAPDPEPPSGPSLTSAQSAGGASREGDSENPSRGSSSARLSREKHSDEDTRRRSTRRSGAQSRKPVAVHLYQHPGPAPPLPPSTHPLYKVPAYGPRGMIWKLDPEPIFESAVSTRECSLALRLLEAEFSKETLSKLDAWNVGVSVVVVANWLYHNAYYIPPNPSAAALVDNLSFKYLCVEAVFNAVQVIGDAMSAPEWWSNVMQQISLDLTCQDKKGEVFEFAKELAVSVESLRNGRRPEEKNTVAVKQRIFCGSNPVSRYTGKCWQVFREKC